MTETILHDLKLIGTTTSAGGRFRNVKTTGESVLTGDVDCNKWACIGSTVIKGSLRTDNFRLTGECKVEGGLQAGYVRGRGELLVNGGSRGENVKFTGAINANGDLECGTFEVTGAFQVEGLLTADKLEVKMFGPCRAKEIGGGTLHVKRSKASRLLNMFKASSDESALLSADLIEGDILLLEYVNAEIVRGNEIYIGPGCVIERVEFRTSFDVHKSATVKDAVKV